ncbi:MAG: SPOR domain-containing protein [Flavobacterium sp.]|nr:SPOR domain-containing protein [Flavobacterium sp.]
MKIEQYIAPLLYRYQCVTVPGFGAFLTEIQSAQLNEASSGFSPPKKLVSFNSYLKNNDGLLANHISQMEKISYESAVQQIQKEVALWKNALQNFQQITLHNIGMFSLNSEGNIVFDAANSVNYFTSSFGLTSFVSPFIKREIQQQLHIEIDETVEEEKPIIQLVPERRQYSYLKYVAIFVIGLGTVGFFANNYHQNQIAIETQLVQTEVQKDVQQKIQEATFFIQSPLPNVTLSVKEQKMPYHIVAGAFRNERNAQRIYVKLSNAGFKSRRLEKNRFGLFPVLYGSYASYGEAQAAMRKIHETQSKEAWLLIDEL